MILLNISYKFFLEKFSFFFIKFINFLYSTLFKAMWKVLGKEKKYYRKLCFHIWFHYEKYERKSNLIKYSYKFLDFKIT